MCTRIKKLSCHCYFIKLRMRDEFVTKLLQVKSFKCADLTESNFLRPNMQSKILETLLD